MEKEITEPCSYVEEKISGTFSKMLNRNVDVTILLPADWQKKNKTFPVLLLNDGQDIDKLNLKKILEQQQDKGTMEQIIAVGVVAGDRMQEYGVAAQRDYMKRGSRAKAYAQYVITELIPYLNYKYPVDKQQLYTIAGCSMGGLSALDIAWNYPQFFSKVGAFSGSFWWRQRDSQSILYADTRDRIMHNQIRSGRKKNEMKFWFQTGTDDEKNDRNKNGVIDSIDDTLDLIVELTKKGYRPFHDIQYLEVQGGRHNIETWAQAMPLFLTWAFGK